MLQLLSRGVSLTELLCFVRITEKLVILSVKYMLIRITEPHIRILFGYDGKLGTSNRAVRCCALRKLSLFILKRDTRNLPSQSVAAWSKVLRRYGTLQRTLFVISFFLRFLLPSGQDLKHVSFGVSDDGKINSRVHRDLEIGYRRLCCAQLYDSGCGDAAAQTNRTPRSLTLHCNR